MKQKRIICLIMILFAVIAAQTPVYSYASNRSSHLYHDSEPRDPDELREVALEGELKLDYFEPEKLNLKKKTIVCTPIILKIK